MLNVFSFSEGRVSYANRFMQTPRLLDARQGRYRSTVSVGTDPCRRLGKRLLSMFDPVPGSEQVTVVMRIGLRNEHRIDAINAGMKRRRIGGAPAGRPPEYMHSFAMTERFVVLPLQPLRYSLPGILRTGKFTECLSWRPRDGTTFAVIDRSTGEVVSTHKAEAFFFWHTINAYEDGDEIVVDIVCDDSPQSLYQIEMDKLRDPAFRPKFYGNARRYRLPLAGRLRKVPGSATCGWNFRGSMTPKTRAPMNTFTGSLTELPRATGSTRSPSSTLIPATSASGRRRAATQASRYSWPGQAPLAKTTASC